MRFWDSSAIVPLVVAQEASARVRRWQAGDDVMVVWTLTMIEILSALRRLVRERALDERAAAVAEERVHEVLSAAHVVVDVDAVKPVAARLLRLHALRAFDALQLGAALLWCEGHPRGRTVHTLDTRLALAARREGFTILE